MESEVTTEGGGGAVERKKVDVDKIWREYERGREYNERVGLYETVKNNENFYIGKQWEDVIAPDLEKPVLNFLRRVTTYFLAMLSSEDIGIQIQPFHADQAADMAAKVLSAEISRVAVPSSRDLRTMVLRIISAVPTSMPRVGWLARMKLAPLVNSRATTTFWMLPPESMRTG